MGSFVGRFWRCCSVSVLTWLLWVGITEGIASEFPSGSDLMEMSIEELMELEVTSVGKKVQKFSETAAAIYVITQDDIRRSGATCIPEALRLAPGLHVARIDSNKWAISCRGFNGEFATKLLVLIDGRSVYTPLFSGVFWDVQDTLLEDIKRIEVIRGPGATLWGANAVNGVINIITRSATSSIGGLAVAGAGNEERGFGAVRVGQQLNEHYALRLFAKGFDRDDSTPVDGSDGQDVWHMLHGGFRLDGRTDAASNVTLQGDIYAGRAGARYNTLSLLPPYSSVEDDDTRVSGGNLLGRWTHSSVTAGEWIIQAYYDRTEREDLLFGEDRDIYDLDLQQRVEIGTRQELVWGLGYRLTVDDFEGNFIAQLDPDSRSDSLWSGFMQDEISLLPNRLNLILGSKLEHNDYTGFEVQPSVRLVWTPKSSFTLWSAISRAVRTPSRAERTGLITYAVIPPLEPIPPDFPGSPAIRVVFEGNDDFESEELWAYEAGSRFLASEHLSFDLALFYNDYDKLRSSSFETPQYVPATPFDPAYAYLKVNIENGYSARTYGGELTIDYHPVNWWKCQLWYAYLGQDGDKGALDDVPLSGVDPKHQASLRSYLDLPGGWEFDMALRYVDDLPALDISEYLGLDVHLAWRPSQAWEFTLVGQNLTDPHHPEFIPESYILPSQVDRSIYAKVTWNF